MKQIVFLILTVFIVAGSSIESISQRLIINFYNGNEDSELLSSIQKLYFSGDQLVVDFKAGFEDEYALSDIRKLYFDPAVSVDEISPDHDGIFVSPNPAVNLISVQNSPVKEGVFRIYRMDGRAILNGNCQDDQTEIDISTLPVGLYLLNIEGFTTKFIKK